MLEILMVVIFIWLFIKAIGFSIKLAWSAAKIIGSLLIVLALPMLFVCLLFASGLILLVPLLVIGIACEVMKS